jgi:predicted nucleic acid-binding protein
MGYLLLDSNVVINYVNRVPAVERLVDRLVDEGDDLCTCSVVLVEVLTGTFARSEERARMLLGASRFLATSRQAAEQAGRWRFAQARRGFQLSLQDALIAATALENFATVVTANVKDFDLTPVQTLAPRTN